MTSKKNKFPLKSRSWVSVGGRALARRLADNFVLSYPYEFTSAVLLLIALILLRGITIMHYRFGSDEPQHLHVVWGWARGFVQYRDLADNHMPLFHILCAPIYKLIGDGKHFDFETVIPASYKIIARDASTVMGVLDGERYEGKERFLSPGIHTFVQTSAGANLVVFSAQAVDRKFQTDRQ